MKKLVSLLMAIIMLLSLSPSITFAENIANNNVESNEDYDPNDWIDDSLFHGGTISLMSATKNRYTILVLDVSGSMSGTRMSKMKEASTYFCQEMVRARGNNSVAIVKFGSSSSLACGFTDDVSILTRTINGLNDGGGTDTAGGLRKAKETYDLGITDISERNVILISDGEPNSQSEARAAFNEMSNDCNVYTLGYNLSSSALSSMNALQNCGFYNVNDTNSIQSSMTKIIEAILSGSTGNIHGVITNNNNVTVYGNKKSPSAAKNDYRVLPGVTLEINSAQYTTDENGQVQIPSVTSGSIKVRKTGYVPKTVTAASINESKKIYLQKDEGDAPIINSVMVGNIDVLTQEYKIDLTSEKEITLKADIYWKRYL